MCIIVYKPKGVPMPSLEVMTNCFKANPHGAGIMYRNNGVIHISKGYMTLEALLEAINLTSAVVNLKKTAVVIHFRISTTGSTIPENCHPFPLSNKIDDLKALNVVCERAVAHNGILHEYSGFHNAETDMSDTMYFCKMLSGVNDRFVESVISAHADRSKFVYMSGKGKTVSFGMFKPKGTGIYYSNTTYLKPVVTVYNYKNYNSYSGKWYGNINNGNDILDKEEEWQAWVNKDRAEKLLLKEATLEAPEMETPMLESDEDVKAWLEKYRPNIEFPKETTEPATKEELDRKGFLNYLSSKDDCGC